MPATLRRAALKFSALFTVGVGAVLVTLGLSGAAAHAQTELTVNTDVVRSIGGISQLDRERYFTQTETILPPNGTNLGNLNQTIGSIAGPNVVTGRISTEFDQFLSQNLPQDATRPGFIDPTALRNKIQGDYRNFVLSGSRYTSIRNNPDAFIVNSGRFGAFWPSYFLEPGTGGLPRADAYAEFINIYLDEAVYGTNAFYPTDPQRFAVELVNEPDLHYNGTLTRQFLVDWHADIIQAVHAVHPDAQVGGPSLAVTSFEDNEFGGSDDFSRFEERLGRLIADRANSDVAFYSFHPYERYDVKTNNTLVRQVNQSPGRVNGTIDLVRSRDLAENPGQDPLPIAFTEYGSFNRLDGDPAAAGYTRAEMQWDLARDIREQLLIYLNRPDAVFNATPFVQGKHFNNTVPTPVNADNVFYEQDASGDYLETIVGNTFRAYAQVKGSYLDLQNGNLDDLQAVAFRDGDQVYVLLNNLLDTNQSVDLSVLTALGGVQSASLDRTFQVGEDNFFVEGVDVTGTFQSLTLNPEEGAVLTLTLANDTPTAQAFGEETFYAAETVGAINQPGNRSNPFFIDAEVEAGALSALVRVTYNRPTGAEGFDLFVNNDTFAIPAGETGTDDGDFGLQSREIEVPLDALVDGSNRIQVQFDSNGGFLASAALVVKSLIGSIAGDYNNSGQVEQGDLDLVLQNWGVDTGTAGVPTGWVNDLPVGQIEQTELDRVLQNWGNTGAPDFRGTTVPEPAAGAAVMIGLVGLARGRARRG